MSSAIANIGLVTATDLDDLTTLFDAYRVFYREPSEGDLVRGFLAERIAKQDSVILLARDATGQALGFTQLYPSFSSTRCKRTFILNDLFVNPQARGQGLASALMRAAASEARARGAITMELATAHTNTHAQAVYEHLGWTLDTVFRVYSLALD
jgi:GNAT superfamily N-acetyltransferase